MNSSDPEAYLKKARWFWFIVLTGILWAIIIYITNEPGAGIGTQLRFVPRLLISLIASYFAAKYIAPIQLKFHEDMSEKAEEGKRLSHQKEAQKAHQKLVEEFDKESKSQQSISKESKSKHELVTRLGSIDQFVRVLEMETEPASRTMALQKAHSEMMTLAARLASGEISRDALDAQEIRELAWETCNDLARIGLENDRLNRDLIRMFKLNAE
jgi:flagellar biosynthesis protein FliQ